MTTTSQKSQPVTLLTLIGVDEEEYRRRRLAELAAAIAQTVRIIEVPRPRDDAVESALQHPYNDADETT